MNALFTTAMALRPLDSDPGNPACRVFEGELNEHWTIGPKVHGGAMVACVPMPPAPLTARPDSSPCGNRSQCRRAFCGRRIRGRCGW